MTNFPTEETLANQNILVVDDELRLASSITDILKNQGYDATFTTNGQEAQELISTKRYQLILLDLNLVNMDGNQLLNLANEKHIQVPVIIISGETQFKPIFKALRRGAYGYLKKPFSPEHLLKSVTTTLAKANMESSKHSQRFRGLYEAIVENSPDIFFVLDELGKFIFVNDQVETSLEINSYELLGKHYSYLVNKTDLDKAKYLFDYHGYTTKTAKTAELRLVNAKKPSLGSRVFEISVNPKANINNEKLLAGEHVTSMKIFSLYGTAHDITERKEAEDFINFQAYHDILTRLPNRVLFKDRLKQAIANAKRNSKKLAVIFLDLDGFKSVNDRFGHAMGDRILQATAERLEGCIRKCDTLSRFGGDEFTLLLPNISVEEDITKIVQKILNCLKEPFPVKDSLISIGVSVGISVYPSGGNSVDALINNADKAMYKIKNQEKNGFSFYQENGLTQLNENNTKEQNIRNALKNNQLCVSLRSKNMLSDSEDKYLSTTFYWNNTKEARLYYPHEFIPALRDTNLIYEINHWFVKTALSEAKNWQKSNGQYFRIRLILPVRQIQHLQFSETLQKALSTLKLSPDDLDIVVDPRSLVA